MCYTLGQVCACTEGTQRFSSQPWRPQVGVMTETSGFTALPG